MKTNILAGLLALATAAAVLPETAAAHPFTADMKPAEGCVIGNACRPLNVDVPVYLWLVGGQQTQGVANQPDAAPRPIRDASLGLAPKAFA
jgi:hypothetical protein